MLGLAVIREFYSPTLSLQHEQNFFRPEATSGELEMLIHQESEKE